MSSPGTVNVLEGMLWSLTSAKHARWMSHYSFFCCCLCSLFHLGLTHVSLLPPVFPLIPPLLPSHGPSGCLLQLHSLLSPHSSLAERYAEYYNQQITFCLCNIIWSVACHICPLPHTRMSRRVTGCCQSQPRAAGQVWLGQFFITGSSPDESRTGPT